MEPAGHGGPRLGTELTNTRADPRTVWRLYELRRYDDGIFATTGIGLSRRPAPGKSFRHRHDAQLSGLFL